MKKSRTLNNDRPTYSVVFKRALFKWPFIRMKTFVAFIFSRFLGWWFRWDFYIIRKIIVDVFPVEIMVNIGEKYLKIVAGIEPRQRLHFSPSSRCPCRSRSMWPHFVCWWPKGALCRGSRGWHPLAHRLYLQLASSDRWSPRSLSDTSQKPLLARRKK